MIHDYSGNIFVTEGPDGKDTLAMVNEEGVVYEVERRSSGGCCLTPWKPVVTEHIKTGYYKDRFTGKWHYDE